MTSQWPVSCRLFSIPPVIWHHVTLIDSNAYRFPNFRISLSNSVRLLYFSSWSVSSLVQEVILFYDLRPVRTCKIFYGPRSSFSRSGPWMSDFKCTWRFWYSWLFPTGLVLRNRIWIRIDHHNKLDKLGKGGSKIYFWIKLIFDQIKKSFRVKNQFYGEDSGFYFLKIKNARIQDQVSYRDQESTERVLVIFAGSCFQFLLHPEDYSGQWPSAEVGGHRCHRVSMSLSVSRFFKNFVSMSITMSVTWTWTPVSIKFLSMPTDLCWQPRDRYQPIN